MLKNDEHNKERKRENKKAAANTLLYLIKLENDKFMFVRLSASRVTEKVIVIDSVALLAGEQIERFVSGQVIAFKDYNVNESLPVRKVSIIESDIKRALQLAQLLLEKTSANLMRTANYFAEVKEYLSKL